MAAWALANLRTEPTGILAVVVVVAVAVAVAAVLLKAVQRPSEDRASSRAKDPGRNDWIAERRSNPKKAAKPPKSAPGKSLAP